MRKGITGESRNIFTRDVAQLVDRYCGQTLIDAGYEKDHAWVETCQGE